MSSRPIKRTKDVPAHKKDEREPEPFYQAIERENAAVVSQDIELQPLRCLYRPIGPGDGRQLKYLHERWFPLRYEPKFYDGVVVGNWGGRQVYTLGAFALEQPGVDPATTAAGDADDAGADGRGNASEAIGTGVGNDTGPSPAAADAPVPGPASAFVPVRSASAGAAVMLPGTATKDGVEPSSAGASAGGPPIEPQLEISGTAVRLSVASPCAAGAAAAAAAGGGGGGQPAAGAAAGQCMVGAVISQCVSVTTMGLDYQCGLVHPRCRHRFPRVAYIMTLGTALAARRRGVASALLRRCVAHYERGDPGVGAVFLHVITYNRSALGFYEHHGFTMMKCVKNYYTINGRPHDCYVYFRPLNGAPQPPPLGGNAAGRRRAGSGLGGMVASWWTRTVDAVMSFLGFGNSRPDGSTAVAVGGPGTPNPV